MTTISYGYTKNMGSRPYMEDTHAIHDEEAMGLFSAEVYDGHGGASAAVLAADKLTPFFIATRQDREVDETWFSPATLRETYLAIDRLITDKGFEGGTAAATLYFLGDKFLVANVGDVRIVAGDGSDIIEMTLDHKPDLPEERARIEGLGGEVIEFGVPRVQGSLAMSRALGDAVLKPYVTAEPRIAEGTLGRRTDIVVLASDGIWGTLSSKEAVTLARSVRNPTEAARLIMSTAKERGSKDNITVVVLDLQEYVITFPQKHLKVTKVTDYGIIS